jgi:hypothetical protein
MASVWHAGRALSPLRVASIWAVFSPARPAAPERGFHQAPAALRIFSHLPTLFRVARLASNVRA